MILLIRAKSTDVDNLSTKERHVLLFSICLMCLFMTIWLTVVGYSLSANRIENTSMDIF